MAVGQDSNRCHGEKTFSPLPRDRTTPVVAGTRHSSHGRGARQHPLSRGKDIQPMVVELDPLPRGKDIQPIAVGQASTRCNGDKDGCEKKYIAVAVVIFIVIVSIYIVITTRERVTEIMKDKET